MCDTILPQEVAEFITLFHLHSGKSQKKVKTSKQTYRNLKRYKQTYMHGYYGVTTQKLTPPQNSYGE
jgi:hypothetical protein